jgi:hypothetical protein
MARDDLASCFDGEESWLCPACADSLRTIAALEKRARVTEATVGLYD